jgi:hypothetical protein
MIKVSAGLSRKVGGPNYSSRGGSVHFEQEFDAGAIHHPERLREGIDKLFALAREALEEELRATADQPKPTQHQQHEEATKWEAEAEVEGASGHAMRAPAARPWRHLPRALWRRSSVVDP